MRRRKKAILLWLGTALILCPLLLTAQQAGERNHLIITHPTTSNLDRIDFLIDNKILELPAHYSLILLFHSKEAYDYQESRHWLDTASFSFQYRIVKLECPLYPDSLYVQNKCSKQFESLFHQSGGIIFFGGPDLPPYIYGEEMSLLTDVRDPYRHYWEASMLYHLLGGPGNEDNPALLDNNPSYAVLGICLGMQTINAATGGSLIQDIPLEVYKVSTVEEVLGFPDNMKHRNYLKQYHPGQGLSSRHIHSISLENTIENILPAKWAMMQPKVVSSHHQAVEILGQNIYVLARSEDQEIVEMIGHEKYPHVLGVQFHPELVEFYKDPVMKADSMSMEFHYTIWENFSRYLSGK